MNTSIKKEKRYGNINNYHLHSVLYHSNNNRQQSTTNLYENNRRRNNVFQWQEKIDRHIYNRACNRRTGSKIIWGQ